MGKVQKILVVQLSKLGDMVNTTHVFRHIKAKYPNVKLYVVGSPINKSLLEGNKDVDEYIVFENDFFDFYKTLKKAKIEVAILSTPNFISLATLFLSGVRYIIAPTIVDKYCPFETISYRSLLRFTKVIPISAQKNLLMEYLNLLNPLGISESGIDSHLEFSKEAGMNIKKFFIKHEISPNEDFIVIISPSSGNKIKSWPESRFASIADHVYKKYQAKIIVIGSTNDTEEVSKMLSALHSETKIINTLNLFTIDELKAVIASADMFISVDSGPLNIAVALNVPTVNILGPVPEYAVKVSELNRIVFNRGGREPAVYPLNNREIDFAEARRQAEAITITMVIKEVDQLYAVLKNKPISKGAE